MPFGQLLILGAIAGLTIFLGLPVAAFRAVAAKTKALLTGVATGILLFLAVEILSKVLGAGEERITAAMAAHTLDLSTVVTLSLLIVGVAAGLLAIPTIERTLIRPAVHGPQAARVGVEDRASPKTEPNPTFLSLSIAGGIGLHNFGEGLAIGQSAAGGALSLAVLLIVGFGLHNMTEGFGIAAPLAGTRPRSGFLIGAGLLAGGPTFVGTLVGSLWTSQLAMVLFLSLAGGSLVYVTSELLVLGKRTLAQLPLLASIAGGFFIGYLTDLVVSLAGA